MSKGEDKILKIFNKYKVRYNREITFPNLFGKWCRPNYNSAVATFCNNIANDLPIQVNNRETVMHLVYIDDVVEELLQALERR